MYFTCLFFKKCPGGGMADATDLKSVVLASIMLKLCGFVIVFYPYPPILMEIRPFKGN